MGDFSLADNAILPVVLMILSLIFAFLSIYNVETKDLDVYKRQALPMVKRHVRLSTLVLIVSSCWI